jgi:hypothetical protein
MQKFLLNKEIREENIISIPKPFSEGGVWGSPLLSFDKNA